MEFGINFDRFFKNYESYDKWNSINVFDDLANTVKILWGNIGIFPENMNNQLFIHVL